MEAKTRAVYLADLNYFQSKMDGESDGDYYLQMAFIYSRLEKYDEAISICTKGLKKFRNYTHLQVLLAEAYVSVGRKDEGRELLFDIVMADQDNYKALKLLGFTFKTDGDNENALKYMRAAYLKAPEDDELLIWIEGLGGLETFVDTSSDRSRMADGNELFENEDDSHFDVDGALRSGEMAMSELMRDISSYKQAGKTIEDMISDHAVKSPDGKVSAVPVTELKGDELSDEDILKALSEAPVPDASAAEKPDLIDSFEGFVFPEELDISASATLPQTPGALFQPTEPGAGKDFPLLPDLPPLPNIQGAKPPVDASQREPAEIIDNEPDMLSDLQEVTPVRLEPANVAALDDLPFDFNIDDDGEDDFDDEDITEDEQEQEFFDEALKIFQNISEEEAKPVDAAAFIPDDLVESVFREAGLDMADMQEDDLISEEFIKSSRDDAKKNS